MQCGHDLTRGQNLKKYFNKIKLVQNSHDLTKLKQRNILVQHDHNLMK